MKRLPAAALAFALLFAAFAFTRPGPAASQEQEEGFKNLKVFPQDIGHDQLIGAMRSFSNALGVGCDYCHVETEKDGRREHDFASDEKATKRTARDMLRMVGDINGQYLKGVDVPEADRVQVRCVTCHRGLAVPRQIEDVVADSLAAGGLEKAVATYKDLHEKYYGSGSYDFTADPLNALADRLAGGKEYANALGILAVNQENHPDSPGVHLMYARVYAGMGEKDKAVAAVKEALELDPENFRARRFLEQLQKED